MLTDSTVRTDILMHTPFGERTPEDVLAKILINGLPAGQTRGLFTQLRDVNPSYAFVAAKHICERREQYEPKLVRVAEETYTGLPIGIKMVHGELSIMNVLRAIPMGSLVRFTFTKERDKLHELHRLLSVETLITFDPWWLRPVLECVAPTGEWQGIERSTVATVTIADESQLVACARILIPILESLELVRAA